MNGTVASVSHESRVELPSDWLMIGQENAKEWGMELSEYLCVLIHEDDEPGLKLARNQVLGI